MIIDKFVYQGHLAIAVCVGIAIGAIIFSWAGECRERRKIKKMLILNGVDIDITSQFK